MNALDRLLSRLTIYKLVLYLLVVLLGIAFVLSLAHILPISAFPLVTFALISAATCRTASWIFSRIFRRVENADSAYITALILACIVTPTLTTSGIVGMVLVGIIAIASKYLLTFRGKQVFNPTAFAVVIADLAFQQSASWWIGTAPMLLFVLIGGMLVVRKYRRFDLTSATITGAVLTVETIGLLSGGSLLSLLQRVLVDSALLFFTFIMVTEPRTSPATRKQQVIYGLIVGILFAPQLHLGGVYATPELALLVGNVYVAATRPKLLPTLIPGVA